MKRTIRLTESDLKNMITETVKRVLREDSRDIDDDRISQKQIVQLDKIADTIAYIANNTSYEAGLLFQAADNIRNKKIKPPYTALIHSK